MNKLLLLVLLVPLCLSSIASLSQDTRTLPRWREEAIVKDLVRYDGCRADRDSLISEVGSLKNAITAHEGKEIILQKISADQIAENTDYQKKIQGKDATIAKVRRRNGLLLIAVAIEALVIILK